MVVGGFRSFHVLVTTVYPRCLFSLIAFEIRCIGRVLLVLGSRLKNEVYIHFSLCLSSVFSFTVCCLLRRKWKRSPSL